MIYQKNENFARSEYLFFPLNRLNLRLIEGLTLQTPSMDSID